MTDFQTFAAVFVLQNFSTKFKILKKNHFKQKCNGFVTLQQSYNELGAAFIYATK